MLYATQQNDYGRLFARMPYTAGSKNSSVIADINDAGNTFNSMLQSQPMLSEKTAQMAPLSNLEKQEKRLSSNSSEQKTRDSLKNKPAEKEKSAIESAEMNKINPSVPEKREAGNREDRKKINNRKEESSLSAHRKIFSKEKIIETRIAKKEAHSELYIVIPVSEEEPESEKGTFVKKKITTNEGTEEKKDSALSFLLDEQKKAELAAPKASNAVKKEKPLAELTPVEAGKKEAQVPDKGEKPSYEEQDFMKEFEKVVPTEVKSKKNREKKDALQSKFELKNEQGEVNKTIVQEQMRLNKAGEERAAFMKNKIFLPQEARTQMQNFLQNDFIKLARLTIQGNNQGEIKLELSPRELGDVKYHIKLEKNSVSARILVENDIAKELVIKNLEQLSKQLLNEGYEIGNFSVSVDFKNTEDNNRDSEQALKKEEELHFDLFAMDLNSIERSFLSISDKINLFA